MSKLTLWKLEASPPARSVMILADMLGLQLEYKDVDFLKMEHKSPEYMKMNPIGTVPLLKDGDFYLTDSHAILKYLLEKYGGDDRERLYPSDVRTRALVDQALFFDTGVYFIQIKKVALPTIFGNMTHVPDDIIESIDDAYFVVETFLKNGPYVAGDQLTIGDIALGMTTAAMQGVHAFDTDKYPRTAAWFHRLQQCAHFKKHSQICANMLQQLLEIYWDQNKTKCN